MLSYIKTTKQHSAMLAGFGLVLALVLVGGIFIGRVSAESYPGGTDNGLTSRIGELDATLTGLGYGTTTATPDWGNMWNRVKTSATWTPAGNATANDVAKGKTFYGNNRTEQTGTRNVTGLCPTQKWHDGYGSADANQVNNCVDQIVWTVPSDGVEGTDKQDPVTGLIWSQRLWNDPATPGAAPKFSASASSTYSWDASLKDNNGKTAIELCSERGNGWRLPTQKELMQAYIDGSFWNLSQSVAYHWSSTENSGANAWFVYLSGGITGNNIKTTAYAVRCVR